MKPNTKNILEAGTLPTGTIQLPLFPTEILELTPEQLEFALDHFREANERNVS